MKRFPYANVTRVPFKSDLYFQNTSASSPVPPPGEAFITAENLDFLTTESGDNLITE